MCGPRISGGSFSVVIPPQAMDHPIWRIVDDPERNRQVLAAMPTFYGTNLIDRLKPAATALGLSQGPLSGSGPGTVFSCQTFGRGRTFAMSTDTTVDWGRDFEQHLGRRRQPLFPQILAERRAMARREQRGQPAAPAG